MGLQSEREDNTDNLPRCRTLDTEASLPDALPSRRDSEAGSSTGMEVSTTTRSAMEGGRHAHTSMLSNEASSITSKFIKARLVAMTEGKGRGKDAVVQLWRGGAATSPPRRIFPIGIFC